MNTNPLAKDSAPNPIIYVDLDGTLIKSDLLLESLVSALKRRPLIFFLLPLWLLRGRAYLKAQLAAYASVDSRTLPYSQELVDYLKRQRQAGHRIVLATASTELLARNVADHVGLFDEVLASSRSRNLKAKAKATALLEHAAGYEFWYAGNDRADIAVWSVATGAILVNANSAVTAAARKLAPVKEVFPRSTGGVRHYLKAIRVYQWAKNLLVFVPLLTAHTWNDTDSVVRACLAFMAFSLSASSIYVLNDLLDLTSDRNHPRKRRRPFASGDLSILQGLMLIPILAVIGLAAGTFLGLNFLLVLLVYLTITIAYSFRLKSYVLIDVGVLASLYTTRVIGGAAAIAVIPSFWLLAFSAFIFLSLALIKRCSELIVLGAVQRTETHGRDYRVSDLQILEMIGVSAGFAAVVVMAFFINSDSVTAQYSRPQALWLLCATVLYWIARMWLKTARGEMHDDPLIYAARDRGSIVMLTLTLAAVVSAI